MAFESVNYQCPACGGPLHFASAEQKLVCDYCDSRFEVEEVEALYRERQDKADAKADAAAAAPKPAADAAVKAWTWPCSWARSSSRTPAGTGFDAGVA